MRRACWTRVRRGKNERLDLPEEREKEGKLSGCWKDWRRGVARDGGRPRWDMMEVEVVVVVGGGGDVQ